MKNIILAFILLTISKASIAQEMEVFGIDVLHLQLIEMEKAMQAQTNTIEKLTNELNKLKKQMKTVNADSEVRFEEMQKQIEIIKTTKAEEKKVEIATPSIDKSIEPKELYDKGIELIRAGKYKEAQANFEAFLAAAPNDELAGNAKYWLGESYYARNDYENAAVIFAQGFQEYPKNIKAPDNLLKLGISMKALKKNAEACTAFTSVAKEFPKADKKTIEKAKNEAKKLACK